MQKNGMKWWGEIPRLLIDIIVAVVTQWGMHWLGKIQVRENFGNPAVGSKHLKIIL